MRKPFGTSYALHIAWGGVQDHWCVRYRLEKQVLCHTCPTGHPNSNELCFISVAMLAQLAMPGTVNKPPTAINPRLRYISCTDSTIIIPHDTKSSDISSVQFLGKYEGKGVCLNEMPNQCICTSLHEGCDCWILSESGRCYHAGRWVSSRCFLHLYLSCGSAVLPSMSTMLSPLNVCSQSNQIFNTCCKTPAAGQSNFP